MNEPLDADARLAKEALDALPRGAGAADPVYRARLKASFASGAIESSAGPESKARPDVRPLPWRGGGGGAGWRAMAAAAAAILLVVLTGILNQGPSWRITGMRGAGIVQLDGKPISVADASMIGKRVPAGVRVEVTDGAELDLRADGLLALQCTAGTDLILPPPPPRWFARRSSLHVREGEIRVSTGPAFKGAKLAVTTPDAALAVTGTTFAVILEATGTCVCVLDGMVKVGPRDGPAAPVTSGKRRYVFRDGRPMEDAAMRDAEQVKLGEFRDAQALAMGAPKGIN
ncbi:MAG TPA: FecR family protein [Candidatus Eisenbacteria bacterium]|nr:FecR family protein [Candidatus Eisenbacteria bacterium]